RPDRRASSAERVPAMKDATKVCAGYIPRQGRYGARGAIDILSATEAADIEFDTTPVFMLILTIPNTLPTAFEPSTVLPVANRAAPPMADAAPRRILTGERMFDWLSVWSETTWVEPVATRAFGLKFSRTDA